MLTENALQFLYDLSQNNNRTWFQDNKKRYEDALKKPFEAAIDVLIGRLSEIEPTFKDLRAKDCIFRIHRDTRFSKDKTPYKTNVSAVLTSGGRKSHHEPGYYLEVKYGALNLGGGAYFLERPELIKLRTAIAQDPQAFRELIDHPVFKDKFGELKGEKNKKLPPEFKEAAEKEPYLFNKQFYFMQEMDPELAIGESLIDTAMEHFQAAKPLNDYLKTAVYP